VVDPSSFASYQMSKGEAMNPLGDSLVDVFVGVENLSQRQVPANSYLAARPWIAMGLALIAR
jgi:hypothetical protein